MARPLSRHCGGVFLAAGLLALGSAPVSAADLDRPAPAPSFSGWYLRGDIGYTAQRVGSLYNVLYDDPTIGAVIPTEKDFSPAPFVGLGIGYRWNDALRTDLTAEYRFRSDFDGRDVILDTGGSFAFDDDYTAWKEEYTFLANLYVDLGQFGPVTPFVGAGIGASYNRISDFTDVNIVNSGLAFGADHGEWHLAWALHAGLAWQVSDRMTLELAYRYLDLGGAASGDLVTYTGTNAVYNPMEFHDLTSHDVKLAVRYDLR